MSEWKFTTLAEYDAEIGFIETEMADIRGQIEKAMADQKETGVYSDPQWFRKAKAALRYKGADHQALLKERAHLRRQLSASEAMSFAQNFVDAAREFLEPSVFRMLVSEAQSRSAKPEHLRVGV